jgi:hypothetical protein
MIHNTSPSFDRAFRLGFAGFAVAVLGVTLGFGAVAVESSLFRTIGFVITGVGVTIGIAAVLAGIVIVIRDMLRGTRGS